MELSIIDVKGKDTGRKVILSDEIFSIEPNDHAIYLDIKQYLANQRQGTHKTKERSEVSYSTKKIKKQKGTGGARAGSIKSPLFVGGGTIFGPKPRDYSFKVNKKVKKLARKSVLSYKAKENNICVVEDFTLKSHKTKEYISLLKDLSLEGKKTLMVLTTNDKNIILSSRNIPKAKAITVDSINSYELLNAEKLIFCEGAVKKIEEMLK